MNRNNSETQSIDNLSQFKEKAKNIRYCADVKNRLFQIDKKMVLWDTAGSCRDASFAVTLFGGTPEEILCSSRDSISGPITSCKDKRYQEIFQTIKQNLDKPDLGLNTGHKVESVPF